MSPAVKIRGKAECSEEDRFLNPRGGHAPSKLRPIELTPALRVCVLRDCPVVYQSGATSVIDILAIFLCASSVAAAAFSGIPKLPTKSNVLLPSRLSRSSRGYQVILVPR